jgi:hypothetical protein
MNEEKTGKCLRQVEHIRGYSDLIYDLDHPDLISVWRLSLYFFASSGLEQFLWNLVLLCAVTYVHETGQSNYQKKVM